MVPDLPNIQAPTTCEELWFRDGNVVFQAGNLVFKVIQSIMSRESPIFCDMFALPQPQADTSETFDGCPLVRLPDTEEDVRSFLLVIFDGNFLEERATKREHALILGMAAKYQATRVLRRVMAILSHDYPDTLEGYDHWMKDSERRKHGCLVASRNCGTNAELHALFLLMNVARKSGMRVLLPAIQLILMSPQGASDEVLADWDKLGIPPEDAFSIVAAKRKLDSLCRTRILFILYGPDRDISDSCSNPDFCHRVRHDIIYLVDGKNGLIEAPFQNIRERADFYVASLCGNCKDEFACTYTEGREKSWEELPSILGLGSWEELRAARTELLGTAT